MVKIDIKKTELVWPGKYDENGKLKEVDKVNLPFQVIESINTSRADREKEKNVGRSLYDFYDEKPVDTFEEGWKNKLIWGDNKLIMSSLLKQFAGKIDLIYIDPPFATGADFSYTADIGQSGEQVTKSQSILEEKAYRDTWGQNISTYLIMLSDRFKLISELLSDKGLLFVHLDRRAVNYVKLILDELLGDGGPKNNQPGFKGEIIWHYFMGGKAKNFPGRKHDNILVYSKSTDWTFNHLKIKRRLDFKPSLAAKSSSGKEIESGVGKDEFGYYSIVSLDDTWDIRGVFNMSKEYTDYPTQKPVALLKRILKVFSKDNDLIADFFCGAGTTCIAAEKLGKRWIACDLSRWAIHTTRKRLLEIENCKPFEILNLGKYERQYWQEATFGDKKKQEQSIFEYIAFILKLYTAEPISGTQFIHGKKGNILVHIGAVDSPITIDEINHCIDECIALKQKKLHILGWEWEMGVNDLMIKEAKGKGVSLSLLNIPSEVMEKQAIEKGDIKFFELAHLEVDFETKPGNKLKISLKDFSVSLDQIHGDIRDELKEKIKKWSDYIDYWAVDWNFKDDTFINGWVSYRTKKNRTLELKSDTHKYHKAGTHKIMVKVVDIFGNDTSNTFEVKVK